MEIPVYFEGSYLIDGGSVSGYALLRYSAIGTYDTHRDAFIRYSPKDTYISDSANFERANYVKEWSIINGGDTLLFYASGKAYFSWVDPRTNVKFQSTVPFTVTQTFDVYDSLI